MYKIIEEKLVNYGTVGGERTAFVLVHIICDTVSGIPQPLPHWVAGSRCDVLEHNGSVYLLSNSRQWEQVNFYNQGGGGGGGGGSLANVDVDVDEEELNFTANQTSFSIDSADENLHFG